MRKIWTIVKKEILDNLREKRTFIIVVITPLFLYPILFMAMGYFTVREKVKEEQVVYQIGVINPDADNNICRLIKDAGNLELLECKKAVESIKKKGVEVVLKIDYTKYLKRILIYYDGASKDSKNALERIERILTNYKEDIIKKRIKERGINENILQPFTTERNNIASAKKMAGYILGTIIPYILILIAFSGAMTSGLDITAGEKDRKTLETLLVTDVKRSEIVIGKTLSIFILSLLSTISGLIGLMITFSSGFSIIGYELSSSASIPWLSCILILLIMLPLIWLFSSVITLIGAIAKSRKEADGYSLYVYFLVILLAVLSVMRLTQPTPKLFMVPVLNIALLQQEILVGEVNISNFIITMVSSFMYASLAFFITKSIFKTEGFLFRE